jgi:His-Xaa-Ser system protein HxsD
LEDGGKQTVKVSFRLKKEESGKELKALQGEFLNELLNYVLRVNLSKENKKIRQQIVEQALFAATNLASIQEKCACEEEAAPAPEIGYSFEDDPLGIAVPWEEKYGNKKDPDKKQSLKK